MPNSAIELRNIRSLSGMHFYIPDYQRGYRWGNTEITNLLNDLNEYCQHVIDAKARHVKSETGFYCLQPVVARKKTWETQDGRQMEGYEIMDGQQRLTTIHIILKYLKDLVNVLYEDFELYTLDYQTRTSECDSAAFLANISSAPNYDDYIDFYYMKNAWNIIDKWFKENTGRKRLLADVLLRKTPDSYGLDTENNARIIWYAINDMDDMDAINIFMRLNVGKIPLTNAELVKALLLRGVNASNSFLLEISRNWDEIEKKLHDNQFWRFLRKSNTDEYENRIEYILELVADKNKQEDDNYYIFNHFNQKYKEFAKNKNSWDAVKSIWDDIRTTFQSLEEIFEDRELYHKIGFLVETGIDLGEILKIYGQSKKNEFISQYIDKEIAKKLVGIDFNELGFDRDKPIVRTVLLLFNIIATLNDQRSRSRFPFDAYKEEKWDVEHITSQIDRKIDSLKQQKEFIEDLLIFFAGSTDKNEDNNDAKDHISNLALLDASTNRSYRNAFFPVKRAQIIENDKNGRFVPLGTKNVFLKYYSPMVKHLLYWSAEDAANYQREIERVLKPFLEDANDWQSP